MDLLGLPVIEIFQDGHKWRWKIMHSHAHELIGASVQKFDTREDCITDLKHTARLVAAWAIAAEGSTDTAKKMVKK